MIACPLLTERERFDEAEAAYRAAAATGALVQRLHREAFDRALTALALEDDDDVDYVILT